MFVGPRTDLGLAIRYDNPNEVGADRLVNGVAGFYKYGGPCVIVDFGTTINFDVISRDAEYLGGAIAVGIGIAIDALFSRTARLPLVEFRPPKDVVGTNTVASMQSGLYFGAIGMIDGILERILEKLGPETKARRHRRTGADDRQRLALSQDGRRASHARRPRYDLGAQSAVSENEDWVYNYFNYFTEVEEHFQRARGTGLFLLSPLDWALLEAWKNAEVPLEAVLRGIDAAFEKWRGRRVKTQMVNSLAFCAQAVLTEAQIMAAGAGSRAQPKARRETAPPFALEDLRAYLEGNAASLPPEYAETAASLRKLAAEVELHYADLEALEQRLTVLEEKMIAAARAAAERRRAAGIAPRTRPATASLPRQDDRRSTGHAGETVPGAQPAGTRETAAPEPLLYALARSG